jgi:hypothetical protein
MKLPDGGVGFTRYVQIIECWKQKSIELGMIHGIFIDVAIGWEPHWNGKVKPSADALIESSCNHIVFLYEGHQCESLSELERLLKLRAFT